MKNHTPLKYFLVGFAALLGGAVLAVSFAAPATFVHLNPSHDHMDHMAMHREDFLDQRNAMHMAMIDAGEYACCLEKPCTYCIEKTPGHGEGATCDCLADVVQGRHPCGECIGEILEGHGNPYLSQYFAASIAEEVGEEHIDTIQQIIDAKYPADGCETEEFCELDI